MAQEKSPLEPAVLYNCGAPNRDKDEAMSTGPLTSKRIEFDDQAEAAEFYFRQGWTDGLPVVPPTAEGVRGFIDYAGRSPSEILGAEPTKGRVITVEKTAINAVMVGCVPEYFPVVVAAVEAMCEPRFNLHAVSVSTMSAAVLTVVNGPIRGELGLNSGVGAFGPGNRANATIGRAIRLVISNVTGAVPGELDKGTLGHGGKYSWCVAEAEEESPWAPLHVERGLNPDESAVTVFAGLSPIQYANHESTLPEDVLASARDALFASGRGHDEIVIVMWPEHVGHMRSAGWTKAQVKEYLHAVGSRTEAEWAAAESSTNGRGKGSVKIPVAKSADSYTLVVAGGAAGGFSVVIPLWGSGSNSKPITKKVLT